MLCGRRLVTLIVPRAFSVLSPLALTSYGAFFGVPSTALLCLHQFQAYALVILHDEHTLLVQYFLTLSCAVLLQFLHLGCFPLSTTYPANIYSASKRTLLSDLPPRSRTRLFPDSLSNSSDFAASSLTHEGNELAHVKALACDAA